MLIKNKESFNSENECSIVTYQLARTSKKRIYSGPAFLFLFIYILFLIFLRTSHFLFPPNLEIYFLISRHFSPSSSPGRAMPCSHWLKFSDAGSHWLRRPSCPPWGPQQTLSPQVRCLKNCCTGGGWRGGGVGTVYDAINNFLKV